MCGIAGGLFWRDGIDARAVVSAMVKALAHRGPDGSGVSLDVLDDGVGPPVRVALGHTRLAIIDTSAAGAQPMSGEDGSPSVTYNGETYNFAELRADLERTGSRFRSRTDTEVVLRGYEAWGNDVVQHLRGMFAFAIWDHVRGRLLLARDRFGIKPLYYIEGDGAFLFASEVRALLASGLVPRRLDPIALWQYLGYQSVPAPRTLVQGVHALEPGHWMSVGRDHSIRCRTYWTLLDAGQRDDAAPAQAAARVGELLRDSVARHLISDVPVGAFLSGGIDSSAVVALVREAGTQPRTFSVGFMEQAFDESSHAALVARRFRTEHTHVQLGERDLLDQLPDALRAMDQPTGDGINTYVVSRAVHERGMTVALSGLGGDELFGGYPSFARLARASDFSKAWARSPAPVRSLAAGAVRTLGGSSVAAHKTAALLETDGSLASMFPVTRQVLSLEQRIALLTPHMGDLVADRNDPYEDLLARAYADAPDADTMARVSFAEARTYMHDVLLRDTDQMAMAHALEVRVPLLDHLLAEEVVGLPDSLKRSRGTPKPLLVEALRGLLPDEIVNRPKQGFTLPFDPWMRGALRPLCERHLGDEGLAGRGVIRSDAGRKLWTSFLSRDPAVSWSRVWVLVALDAWLDHNGELAW